MAENGAAGGTRTPYPIITNDVLYQMSYSGLGAGFSTGFRLGKALIAALDHGFCFIVLNHFRVGDRIGRRRRRGFNSRG